MTPFLKQAIQTLISEHTDLEDVVIVLPSKRARVFLQHYLSLEIEKVQFAPDVFSIEAFIEHLSSLKKANQTHQLFCLYKAYQKNIPKKAQDDFTIFMQWGSRLLKDFNDLDAYRLNAKESLENLGEFYQLEGFNLPDNQQSFRPVFWGNLYTIYQDFQSLLLTQQMATLGMLYRDALDALEIYLAHTAKTHYFIGFNALNQSEQDLIQEFLVKNKGRVLWDLDHCFYSDHLHAAGRFIQSYQKEWKYFRQNPQTFDGTSFLEPKKIQAIGFNGNIAQAQYVREFLETYQKEEGKTAIVLGNESLLLPVLGALPEKLAHWNVTMGYAIAQLPLSGFFTSLIDLHATQSDNGLNRSKTLKLLAFPPFAKLLSKDGMKVKERIQALQENYTPQLSAKEMASLITTKHGKIAFGNVEKEAVTFVNRLLQLIEVFETAFYQEKEHFSCAVLALVKKVFSQLIVQLQRVNFTIDCKALFHLFQESLSLQTLDFSGDPVQGVQIMGMLETRTLDFDHILITNVNEGILPVGKNDQSFFPFAMKRKFGLPTFLDNDAIYTYHFYRLLQRAKNIYLLYNSKSEGLNAGEKSRFIRQLAFNDLAQHNFNDYQHNTAFVGPIPKNNDISKTPEMILQLKELALRGFSPTSLSAYLVDPIAFYNRYLLKINDDLTTAKVLSNLQRGTLVHDCLEELYTPFIGQPMQEEYYDKMQAKLPGLMQQHYQKIYPRMPIPNGENHLILKAYERSIYQFLAQEKALVENGNEIIIQALELPFKQSLPKTSFATETYLIGKIDRVDKFNGTIRLIDYKTGNVDPAKLAWSNWEGFSGEYKKQALFQLLLYAWAHEADQAVALGIVSLKSPNAYVLPLVRKDVPKEGNTDQVDTAFKKEIEQYLTSLILEIFDEKKSFVSLEQDEE